MLEDHNCLCGVCVCVCVCVAGGGFVHPRGSWWCEVSDDQHGVFGRGGGAAVVSLPTGWVCWPCIFPATLVAQSAL